MYYLYQTLMWFFKVIETVMMAYCVLSWIMPGSTIYNMLGRFLEPIVYPFRKLNNALLGRFNIPIDFSILFAFFALGIARNIVSRIFIALLW